MDAAGEALPPTPEPDSGVSALDRAILAFESQWWKYAGTKEQAVQELFGMSPEGYYERLDVLINLPAARRADPMLARRLSRLRGSRRRAGTARGLGFDPQ
ncbi:DUF3263 domain-containing protein [Actinoalloteichus sp. AHMU CJ021]|uniref:DUF3263 domain-containing protein n=1 Tax=Actinoalloteichus caeruleus DSM 43889 TaxID=1120930 RepID=A0ABT1JJU8_ACTCY|nr:MULTISPECIES: DUF3263 domain-containing protein [Actinoalloteichus]AUS78506.1 DUF3263 domain-containing protein [Actinoalloteichus sp. AHMU CJ021]MCP2332612.1 Protein of unknown function (DUF3263) [Actinoalloteichus caeruleus DSM 43889]